MTVLGYEQGFDDTVATTLRNAAPRNRALAERLADAHLSAGDIYDVASLANLPILTKDALLDQQHADPPFGGLLSNGARPRRIFQSPGPIYEPEPVGSDPWGFGEALEAAGFDESDTVLNAFGYHLSPAGAMFEQACFAVGAVVVPAGVGSKDLQIAASVDLGATAYVGTPSYLKSLLDHAEATRTKLRYRRAFVTGEPLPPSLRTSLERQIAVLREGFGTAETGCLAFECEAVDGMHVASGTLVQICDLTTGQPVYDDREGQVVVTRADTDYPIVRFGTGDLSAWIQSECPCGRVTPRLQGWLGSVGDAVKVRGMFLHPRQVAGALAGLPGLVDYRLEIDRHDHHDRIRLLVLKAPDAEPDRIGAMVEDRFRNGMRLSCDVEVVNELPGGTERFSDLRAWS